MKLFLNWQEASAVAKATGKPIIARVGRETAQVRPNGFRTTIIVEPEPEPEPGSHNPWNDANWSDDGLGGDHDHSMNH